MMGLISFAEKILKYVFSFQWFITNKTAMSKINLTKEINEIKNQLSYSKNIGFFFGAGTSCALGIPNIELLTEQVETQLSDDLKDKYSLLRKTWLLQLQIEK